MKAAHRTRIILAICSMTVAIVAAIAYARHLSLRRLPEALRERAAAHGLSVRIGHLKHGVLSATLKNVEVGSRQVPGIVAIFQDATLRPAVFGGPEFALDNIHVRLDGEPSELLPGLLEFVGAKESSTRVGPLSAEYRHKAFGRVTFEGLSVERRDDGLILHADRFALGSRHWGDVVFRVRRRNQMVEVGVGDVAVEEAPIQLGYFPSTGGASQWTVTLKHQPARLLGIRLGWDPGPSFDATAVVGALSFIVPDDAALEIRGSMQLALDRWPKPNWPHAEALLGDTASFVARIEPSADMATWNLPDVEVSLSIFSLVGVGRLEFGAASKFALDVQGARRCAQLEAHLPESIYATSVHEYLNEDLPAIRRANRRLEEMSLRLQWRADQGEPNHANVGWLLRAGCGISELSAGAFEPLRLPAFVRKKRNDPH